MTKRFTILLATFVVAAGFGAAAPTTAQAQDNKAVAVNLEDGAEVFRFAFQVVRTSREVVDQTNAAVAYASCEACRTIAVAFQVVLVMSDPEIVTPENIALALNYECQSCETLASAYQLVFSVPKGFRFSDEARRAINEIRRALRELIRSGRPITEIQAEIDALADELRAIVRREIDRFAGSTTRPLEPLDDDEAETEELDEDADVEEGETAPTETTEEPTGTTETTETTETTSTP